MSLLVIIRHVNERSLPLCLEAIRKQTSNYHIVNHSPFIHAVKECFKIGLESNDKYLLTVDADVVLLPNALERILQMTEELIKTNGFLAYIEFYSNDKFRGPISNGCHIYVNRYTPLIYDYFEPIAHDPNILRPESKPTFDLLRDLGLDWIRQKSDPVGYHDFEQYFLHLFVKWRNIAVKNVQNRSSKKQMFQDLLNTLLIENKEDLDYLVAHRAFTEGLKERTVVTDVKEYHKYIPFIQQLGITEKKAIKPEEIGSLLKKLYSQPIKNQFIF